MTSLFLPDSAVTSTDYPDTTVASQARPLVSDVPQSCVGLVSHDALTPDQRESAIRLAGDLVVKYEDEYKRTGCFAARGNADRFRLMQRQLIAGRTNPQERTE
jgi:hypothetical protein